MKNFGVFTFSRVLLVSGAAALAACNGMVGDTGAPSGGSNSGGSGNPGMSPGSPGTSRPGGTGSNGTGSNGTGSNGTGTGSNGTGNNGTGNNGPGPGGSGSDGPPLAPSAQLECQGGEMETVGRRALRRLTASEFEATVRAAFSLDATAWKGPSLPPDPASLDGFGNNVDRLTVGPEYARRVLDSSRDVAKLIATDAFLTKNLPCGLGAGDGLTLQPCGMTFVKTYGAKLYRRPLTNAEMARYMDLFSKVGRASFKNFVHWAVLTMLQSPRVLYRSELGTAAGGKYTLTPYEVASSLAYTFTGGPPTDELLMAAAGNRLQTADQIEAAAKALVFDAAGKVRPAFANQIAKFTEDWMGISSISNLKKDDQQFPDFTPEIQDALAEETRRFVAGALFDDKATPATLLTAPYTFVDARLAKYYGLPAGGADFTKAMRPANAGLGLLGQGSFLSVEAHSQTTSPTKRGYFVRTRLLCGIVPPPPPVVGDLPPPTEGNTTRERYEKLHVADPSCKGCHMMMDQIGFAFEHLDATGRYREKEGRFDIDDSAKIAGTTMGDLNVKGATELSTALAKLPEVQSCMASYMAAYAFGVSQKNASCLVASATKDLRGGMSLVDFYIRMARSEHFRTRMP
jgi:hypothetical protein